MRREYAVYKLCALTNRCSGRTLRVRRRTHLNHPSESYQYGLVLEFAEFKEYGNRLFLSGRSVGFKGENWNIPTAVAWESVSVFMLFSSREELYENMTEPETLLNRLRNIGKSK